MAKLTSKAAAALGRLSWEKRSKKIIKRYADDRQDAARRRARFNIRWSNVQTIHPAIYAIPPKPNIDRRYQDDVLDYGI